ncbi:MAG: TaqI-like C-terminal specificity domain-containing protein [Victivallaceae bacterium]|jgi:tRNA1(Val) A37 N6-methylase TrmN6
MNLIEIAPRKALNKAFLKVKPSRNDIELFKTKLSRLIEKIDEYETEEFHKNLVSLFLRETYYGDKYFINTKGRNDLVIHTGKDAYSPVGVIIEAKSPVNTAEMLRKNKLNTKAFQELVLYYMRERITGNNLEIKYLAATNIYEWFIFDAAVFEKAFARNSKFVKLFNDFEAGRLVSANTDFFYKQVAEPEIDAVEGDIAFAYFDIRDYEEPLRNADKRDDNKLIALYKLLSPEHLLKLPFANDSNSLDKTFYSELLHIIGLTETKTGGKKLIERKPEGGRDAGALLENAINQLDSLDKLARLPNPRQFGETPQERLFNAALELVITWINRVLFLKLLEAQLIKYHKGDAAFAFLNSGRVPDYDALNSLFFQVLAKKPEERGDGVKKLFANVPYLNSSLFEPTELEHNGVFISQLSNEKIPVLAATVLKDERGRRKCGGMDALEYLFEFLNAYDFSSEGAEDIQEDNKALINASVLGLIFEKINGYKDGSFFTPGFITMYMCREAIRRAVVRKFNAAKGWNCENIDQVFDKITDKQEANGIINSLKICDPAVGSGHFLVSALNEIIAVKSDLKILLDRQGKTLRDYQLEVVNDELIVTDDDGKLFEYNPGNKESQRVQETLFHEKQTIIESCLFGVDINPNSVKICRLRLWIELLKNAYYKAGGAELETLPNIDINIKCGNSLISRYDLDTDIRKALRKSKWTIASYRLAVMAYRNAASKDEKRSMEKLIDTIKSDFETEINHTDRRSIRAERLGNELNTLLNQRDFFEISRAAKNEKMKQVKKLTADLQKLEAEIETVKSNKIYENAFEWRFEFPEVLNDDGEFVGFDVVIGNPPYGVNFNKKTGSAYESQYQTFNWRGESYTLFIERAVNILNAQGHFGFINPDTLLNLGFTEAIRMFLLENTRINEIDLLPANVFPDATVDTILLFFRKNKSEAKFNQNEVLVRTFNKKAQIDSIDQAERSFKISTEFWHNQKTFNIKSDQNELAIIQRIDCKFPALIEYSEMFSGIKVYEIGKGSPPQTAEITRAKPFTADQKIDESWLPFFDGKHIGRYQLLWNQNNWIQYGKWLAAPRNPENFDGKKILIRKITGRTLIANYVSETSYCNSLLFVLKLKPENARISYKTLLGVINSSFIGWYFRKKFQISDEDTFPQIMIRDIQQFAIPNEPDQKIELLVDQILAAKQADPGADTQELEREIDRLVYELYGLTEEEIKLVEGE